MTVPRRGVGFNLHVLIVAAKAVATAALVCLFIHIVNRINSAEVVSFEDCVKSVRVGDQFYKSETILNLTDELVGLAFDDQDNLLFLTRFNASSATKLSVLVRNNLQPIVAIDEIPKQVRQIKKDYLTGRIYLATDSGLYYYDRSDTRNKIKLYAFDGINIQNLFIHNNGTIFIIDDKRNVKKIDKNGEKNYSLPVSKPTQLAVDTKGKVYRVKDMFALEILQHSDNKFKYEDVRGVNDIEIDSDSNSYIITMFGFDYLSASDGLHYKVLGVSPNAISIAFDSKHNFVLGYPSKVIKYTHLVRCLFM